jgi:uncharacterized membrane protein
MPPFHPISVHFPLALLLVAGLLEVLALIRNDHEFTRAGWWTQLAGTIGIGISVLTGILASDSAGANAKAAEALGMHEQMAFVAAAAFCALLLWRLGSRTNIPGSRPWLYVGLYLTACGILVYVGWLGGELVFTHGVGVK